MSARPQPSVFLAWLAFYVLSTALTLLAAWFVTPAEGSAAAEELENLQPGQQAAVWGGAFLGQALLNLARFARVVREFFGPAFASDSGQPAQPSAAPGTGAPPPARPRLPILLPWFLYFVVSTPIGYVLSIILGVLAGAAALQDGRQFNPNGVSVLLVVFVFALAPASWVPFRWVATHYYVRPLQADVAN